MSGNGLTEGFWDSFSPLYSDLAQGDIPLRAVDVMFEEGILRPDDSVLEVGCGKGAYSMLIAPRVRVLTCMDISDRMLDHLFNELHIKELGRVERFHKDWNTYTPRKGYAACFCAMLPRASSEESLLRMEGAAKERCATVVWERNLREDLMLRIRDELGIDWPKETEDPHTIRDWLEENGREFSEHRIVSSVESMVPAETVIAKEISRFRSAGFTEGVEAVVRDCVSESSEDGLIRYHAGSSAVMYAWKSPLM